MNKIININILDILKIFILCFYFCGCNNIRSGKITDYKLFYSIENQENKIIEYQIRIVKDSFKIRNEKIYLIDTLGKTFEQSSSKYFIGEREVYKYFDSDDNFQSKKLYLSIKKDSCVEFNANDESTPVVNCFLKVIRKNDLKMYVFKKSELAFDGIQSTSYYDSKFILIREEYPDSLKSRYVLKKLKDNSKLLSVLKDTVK